MLNLIPDLLHHLAQQAAARSPDLQHDKFTPRAGEQRPVFAGRLTAFVPVAASVALFFCKKPGMNAI